MISSTLSSLVAQRRRLRISEQALLEKAQELEAKNRALVDSLRELKRLQGEVVAQERRAAIAETIKSATYEMERPLVSISVYVEEVLRTLKLHEAIHPLVEKIGERVQDMEAILARIRDLRKAGSG